MAALFFLAFAYFAVGQATVTRNSAQTAADSAALAAARENRNEVKTTFLAALTGGDANALTQLLLSAGKDDAAACGAADAYAADNGATVPGGSCVRAVGPLPGYTVSVVTKGTVGKSVIQGTENKHAKATATAVVEPRCTVGKKAGHVIPFTCDKGTLDVDPTANGFTLDLSDFYSVHLSK
jgi:hypothetical protein